MRLLLPVALLAITLSTAGLLGAQPEPPAPSPAEAPAVPSLFEWQVLETQTGQSVEFDRWVEVLAQQDVLYVGEEHHNRFHVIGAVKILEALIAKGRRPAIGLEMFSWDVQPVLDRYVAGDLSTTAFLEQVHWTELWGGSYDNYAPLLETARTHHLPVLALNPPRRLVRRVVAVGLATAQGEADVVAWGMGGPFLDDPRYAEVIISQVRLCHPGMSPQGYQRMLEASVFRDEGMAKTITEYLARKQQDDGPVLSYTGGGHIQYELPVPKRVERRVAGVQQRTIYLSSFEVSRTEELRRLAQDGIADYLWLTPLGAHGAPRKCG